MKNNIKILFNNEEISLHCDEYEFLIERNNLSYYHNTIFNSKNNIISRILLTLDLKYIHTIYDLRNTKFSIIIFKEFSYDLFELCLLKEMKNNSSGHFEINIEPTFYTLEIQDICMIRKEKLKEIFN